MGASAHLVVPDEDSYLLEYRQFRERLIKLRHAWEEFTKTGQVTEPEAVKPEVLASWERCRARMLDPYDSPNVVFLSPDELKNRLEEYRQVIRVATPFLQALARSVQGSGFRIDFFDRELFLLAQYGEEEALREAKEHGSTPGVNRSEINCGTSAINLAARLQQPVQLVGPEHYKVALHYWTCSAVPIFSPKRDFLGVINIAGHFSLLHKHTLGMALAIGKAIEQSLQQLELISALESSNQQLNNVIQAVSDGLVVVDLNGVITTANQSARTLFGAGPNELVGRRADDVFGLENPISEVLRCGHPIVNKEILLKARGRKQFFVGTIEPIGGKQGTEGVMAVLKPLASAKGFVQNVAGLKAHFTFADLVGDSPRFRRAVEVAKQAAELPTTILLQGESGTGKELFAQAIHNASPYKEGPFVALNCAAIPGELVESELFGYESGAFTGARKEGRPGKFELAEGGSLFLDEIGSMPLNMQAKLLRVLQNRTIMRVGGVTEIPLSTRLICATNRDLYQQVREGTFREDLFYRINVLTIVIPPLRERLGDLPALVNHFCTRLSQRMGVRFGVEAAVYDLLASYQWPGNVRELENLIERSLILALSRGSRQIQVEDILSYPGLRKATKPGSDSGEPSVLGYNLRKVELGVIREALRVSNGNLSQAAGLLGIHRTTLHRKLKSAGVHRSNMQHMSHSATPYES